MLAASITKRENLLYPSFFSSKPGSRVIITCFRRSGRMVSRSLTICRTATFTSDQGSSFIPSLTEARVSPEREW